VVFFFGAQTGGEGTTSTFDVYRWSSATNTSTQLSSAGARSTYPKTDGQRVVWQQSAGALSLISQGVTGGTLTTLTFNAGSFKESPSWRNFADMHKNRLLFSAAQFITKKTGADLKCRKFLE